MWPRRGLGPSGPNLCVNGKSSSPRRKKIMLFAGHQEQLPCSLLKPGKKTPSKQESRVPLSCPPPPCASQIGRPEGPRPAECSGPHAQSAPMNPYPHLRKELEQCKKDRENARLLSGAPMETSKMSLLRGTLWGKDRSDCDCPLPSTEVRNFKRNEIIRRPPRSG